MYNMGSTLQQYLQRFLNSSAQGQPVPTPGADNNAVVNPGISQLPQSTAPTGVQVANPQPAPQLSPLQQVAALKQG
jgi:hypothetical protein